MLSDLGVEANDDGDAAAVGPPTSRGPGTARARDEQRQEPPACPLPAHHAPAVHAAGGSSSSEPVAPLCVICLHRPRTHALLPCGHRALCSNCADQYATFCGTAKPGATDGERAAPHRQPQPVGQGAHRGGNASGKSKVRKGKGQEPKGEGRGKGDEQENENVQGHNCPLCRREVTGVVRVFD